MPVVLCGLPCLEESALATASDVAREFLSSLDPALEGPACEVYRLQRLAPDAVLSGDDVLVCRVPQWQFDFAALEDMHGLVEELRRENETLQIQYARAKEAMISLNSAVEATEALEAPHRTPSASSEAVNSNGVSRQRSTGGGSEVQQLRQQLAQSEKKQHETKATVMALRSEFMQLVNLMDWTQEGKYPGVDLPIVMKELDNNVRTCWAQEAARSHHAAAAYEGDKLIGYTGAPSRHVSQPPPGTAVSGVRRPAGNNQQDDARRPGSPSAQRRSPTGGEAAVYESGGDTVRAQYGSHGHVLHSRPAGTGGRKGAAQVRGGAHSTGVSGRQ